MMLLKISVITICALFLDLASCDDVHFARADPSETDRDTDQIGFELPESNKENFPQKERSPQEPGDYEPEEPVTPSTRQPWVDNERPSNIEPPQRQPEQREDNERPSRIQPPQTQPEERKPEGQPRDTEIEPQEEPVGVHIDHPEYESRIHELHLNYERACSGHECKNNGTCTTEKQLPGRAYSCNCKSSFGGPLCEIVDPCRNNPCGERQICLTTSALDTECGRKCYNRRTGQHMVVPC